MTLAIDGGKKAVTSPLRPYNSIGETEIAAAVSTIKTGCLSGFLGGERHGGAQVQALEQEMCAVFGSKHAVASNSATSGLLIACMACGVGPGDRVGVPALTMSATAAAPAFLGAEIGFGDVDGKTFDLAGYIPGKKCKAIITTNLFGHPSRLKDMMALSNSVHFDGWKWYLIEDNAQGWFAREGNKYAGTIGHIGVFSFNVHKHLQCGEGGVCLTDDDMLAEHMRMARNHGELRGYPVGLNLRMTEVEAAIALAQLAKGRQLVDGRIAFAEELTHMAKDFWTPPLVRANCIHAYYCWAMLVEHDREWVVDALNAEGVPIKAGYVDPLYRLRAFCPKTMGQIQHCPVAERLHDETMCLFEVCAYDPSREQLNQMRDAFEKVGEAYMKRTSR